MPAILVLLIIISCMAMLLWDVRTKELRAARWSVAGTGAASNARDQKRVFVRSMLYIGSFLPVLIPDVLTWARVFEAHKEVYQYAASFLFPIQGVLNALIYAGVHDRLQKAIVTIVKSIVSCFRLIVGLAALTFRRASHQTNGNLSDNA